MRTRMCRVRYEDFNRPCSVYRVEEETMEYTILECIRFEPVSARPLTEQKIEGLEKRKSNTKWFRAVVGSFFTTGCIACLAGFSE